MSSLAEYIWKEKVRPENLDKLIFQQMCKFKSSKIERIDEEDEATSSMMQSDDQNDKKDEIFPLEENTKIPSNDFNFTELEKKDNSEIPTENTQEFKQINQFFSKNLMEKHPNIKTIKHQVQTEPTEMNEKSFDGKNNPKKANSNRKLEQSNSLKTNSLSVVEMLQRKHLSFMKNVISIGRARSHRKTKT